MIEFIEIDNKTVAIILRSEFKKEGIEFFTPPDFSQQLGYMLRPKGYVISPHYHNIVQRDVFITNEVLFIKSGTVKVDFYDTSQNFIESRKLSKGDVILLAHGGHGFEILEEAEIIEVKQGPWVGDRDKTRF